LCFQKKCIEAFTLNSIDEKTHFFVPVFRTSPQLSPFGGEGNMVLTSPFGRGLGESYKGEGEKPILSLDKEKLMESYTTQEH
jgi:hypothetical protein